MDGYFECAIQTWSSSQAEGCHRRNNEGPYVYSCLIKIDLLCGYSCYKQKLWNCSIYENAPVYLTSLCPKNLRVYTRKLREIYQSLHVGSGRSWPARLTSTDDPLHRHNRDRSEKQSRLRISLVPRHFLSRKREKTGLGDNPGRKCPEGMLQACNNDVTTRLLWLHTQAPSE